MKDSRGDGRTWAERPERSVSTLAQDGAQYSDNPTFRKEFERIVEGARKAGLPER